MKIYRKPACRQAGMQRLRKDAKNFYNLQHPIPSVEGRIEEIIKFKRPACLPVGRGGLLSKEQNDEVCDATKLIVVPGW
jgi:hypothetical protein